MDRRYFQAIPNGDHSNSESDDSTIEAENETLLYNLVYHTKELYEEQETPCNYKTSSSHEDIDSLFTVSQKNKVFRLNAVKDIVKSGISNSKGPLESEVKFNSNSNLGIRTGREYMPSEIQVHNNNSYGNMEIITQIDTNLSSLASNGGTNVSTNNDKVVLDNKSFNNSKIEENKLSKKLNTAHGFRFEKNGKFSFVETAQEDYLQITDTKDLQNAKECKMSSEDRYCNSMEIVRGSNSSNTRNNLINKRKSVIIEHEQKIEQRSSIENSPSKYDIILNATKVEAENDALKYVNTIKTGLNSTSDVIHGKECEIISITSSDSDSSVVEIHIPPPNPPPMLSLQSSDEDTIAVVSDGPKKRRRKRKRKPKSSYGSVCDTNNFESNNVQNSNNETSHLSSSVEQSSDNLLVLYSAPEKRRVNVPNSISITDALIHSSDKQNSKKMNKKKKSKKRKVEEKEGSWTPCHPLSWTPNMVQFYDHSWGGETYDHIKLLKNMSGHPSKWRILDGDRFDPLYMTGTVGKVRCRNCNQLGHKAFHCPDPRKVPRCYMCGESGHQEPRCPNKLCLKCGSPSYMYVHGCSRCQKPDFPSMCDSCGQYGHFVRLCPNSWRTFHSVTTEEEARTVSHEVSFKPKQLQFCCNCAEQGHHVDNCGFLSASFRFHHPYNKLPRTNQEKKLQVGKSHSNGKPAHKIKGKKTKKSKIKKMCQSMALEMRYNPKPSKRRKDSTKKLSRAFLINKYIN